MRQTTRYQNESCLRKTRSQTVNSCQESLLTKNLRKTLKKEQEYQDNENILYEPRKTCSEIEESVNDLLILPRKTRSEISNRTLHAYVRFSSGQKNRLEEIFRADRYPNSDFKEKIAEDFCVEYERVSCVNCSFTFRSKRKQTDFVCVRVFLGGRTCVIRILRSSALPGQISIYIIGF